MSPLGRGTLKQSVVVGAARGAGGEVRVQAVPGEDVVLLHLGGGPTLVLHPETARDLMQAQAENVRSRSADDAADGAEVLVPVELRWRGLEEAVTSRGPTRGLLGSVLEQHAEAYPTIERSSLCGSACKRLALVEAMAGRGAQERDAIVKMREHYTRAAELAHTTGDPDLFYPALNRMAAEVVVDAAAATWKGFDVAETDAVRQSLARKVRDAPDFWSVVGVTELDLYMALAAKHLADEIDDIVAGYARLHARDDRSPMWESVIDQLDFVLPKYAKRSSAAEATAAGKLRARIEEMVRGPVAPPRGAARPKKAGAKKRRPR
jgi:hypothetical protein